MFPHMFLYSGKSWCRDTLLWIIHLFKRSFSQPYRYRSSSVEHECQQENSLGVKLDVQSDPLKRGSCSAQRCVVWSLLHSHVHITQSIEKKATLLHQLGANRKEKLIRTEITQALSMNVLTENSISNLKE